MHKFLLNAVTAALLVFGLTAQVQVHAQTAQPIAAVLNRTADTYSSAVATEWMSLALILTQQTTGFSPPVASRALAYLGLALYESTVAGMPGYTTLAGQLNELSSLPLTQPDEPLHWPTVANASMATMMRMMFSNATAENKGRIDQLESSLPLKYGQDFDPNTYTPEITNRSDSYGKLMAMAIMTWARTDGGHEAWGPLRRNRANYVPYLSGERTPHNDAVTRGSFHELSNDTDAAALAYAVIEGVSFGLADGMRALQAAGCDVKQLSLVGGGARSALWAQQLASLLNINIVTHEESAAGGALGAARLGWLATGASVADVCLAPKISKTYKPDPEESKILAPRYERFRAIYPALKAIQK
jgi:sugar (pentulose or hexulose) kinase